MVCDGGDGCECMRKGWRRGRRGEEGRTNVCGGQSVRLMRERIDMCSGESACRKDERRRERI